MLKCLGAILAVSGWIAEGRQAARGWGESEARFFVFFSFPPECKASLSPAQKLFTKKHPFLPLWLREGLLCAFIIIIIFPFSQSKANPVSPGKWHFGACGLREELLYFFFSFSPVKPAPYGPNIRLDMSFQQDQEDSGKSQLGWAQDGKGPKRHIGGEIDGVSFSFPVFTNASAVET